MLDIHFLKQRLQSHFSDGLVTIVGSGLSCAEGLPGMKELAAHLNETLIPSNEEDCNTWSAIKNLIASQGLEGALLKIPPSQSLETAIVNTTAKLIAMREKLIIEEIFNQSRKLRLSKLIPHMLKPKQGLPIITTNYDRLVEIAVEDAGLGVDTMFVGQFIGELNPKLSRLSFCRDVSLKNRQPTIHYNPRAIVLKPHGSLDWIIRNDKPVRYSGELNNPIRLIITPGKNKFRNGYDSPFDIHRERANKEIDSASRFLVLGYGFNDDHLETHLMPSIKKGNPTLILTHGLSTVAEKLAQSYSNVIAIDHKKIGTESGCRVYIDKVDHFIPNLDLWDVNVFIREVLEP